MKIEPNQVIPSNTRFDMTVTGNGTLPKTEISVVTLVIDSGPHQGRKLSSRVADHTVYPVGRRLSAMVEAEFTALVDGEWVVVERGYKDSNPRIRYSICHIGDVSNPSTIPTKNVTTQFRTRRF